MVLSTPVKKVVHKTDKALDTVKVPIYVGGVFIMHVLYLVVFFGLYSVNKIYIEYLKTFVQLFAALFLMFRFNPWREAKLHANDATIIFGFSLFILSNVIFTEEFLNQIEKKILEWFPWLKNYIPNTVSKIETHSDVSGNVVSTK
jgi:hypothetical protein